MNRKNWDTEDYLLPTTRRSTAVTEAMRMYSTTVDDCYPDSSRAHFTPLSVSTRDRSNSPSARVTTGTLASLQYRIHLLETQNRYLTGSLANLENRRIAENEAWKRKLTTEIAISKNREIDLISRFNAVERLVKVEERRSKETESLYKNSEAALLIRLDQNNADFEALEAKLQSLTRENQEIMKEKLKLEQENSELDRELHLTRTELVNIAEELKQAYADIEKYREKEENTVVTLQIPGGYGQDYVRDPPAAPQPSRASITRSSSFPLLKTAEPAVNIPFGPVLTSVPRVHFPSANS